MLAHAETLFRPFLAFGTAILGKQKLDPRLRELTILQVSRLTGAEYEWVQHVGVARELGVREEEIRALERGDLSDASFDPFTRSVLRFVSEAVEEQRVSDPVFEEVRARLSPRELVELLLTAGFYFGLALVLRTLEVDLDEPAGKAVVEASKS
ncbi:MAG: hypothetical protein KatS3mg076_2342 [Candidatus Binatia bacterium]|nr:MAG: hypothetical protein KatS3mg076_2342 [Candidatus Binatia bacterium]